MSNNPNNLSDFLNKNKQSVTDDFDKDALEGFETLGSNEEVYELKASLDKKINKKLFSEKKINFSIIWYAAASLFLIIGFSVFYIVNYSHDIIKSKDVSLVTVDDKKAVVPNEIKTLNESNATVNAEEKKEVRADKNQTKNELQTIKQNQGPNSNLATEKASEEQSSPKKIAEAELDNLASANNESANDETKFAAGKASGVKERMVIKSPVNIGAADAKNDDNLKDRDAERESNFNAPVTTSASNNSKSASDEDKLFKSDVKKETAEKGKKSNLSRKKSRAEESPSSTAVNTKSVPGYYKADDSESEKTIDSKSNSNSCYYNGGDAELRKDVSEKLITKNVNYKFDAVLLINEKKQVEKVNFTNIYDLNTSDKNKIESLLKTLTKFDFYIPPTQKALFEFKLLYHP